MTEQWCDRYVLERIHRETLGRLRAEVEPCSDQEFAAFRLRWFHLGDSDLPAESMASRHRDGSIRRAGLYAQRCGKRRFSGAHPGYRPEYLDLACLGGAVRWLALPSETETSPTTIPERVALYPAGASPQFRRYDW